MKIRKEYLKKWQTIKTGFWNKTKEAEHMKEEKARAIQNAEEELFAKEVALLEELLKKEKTVRDMVQKMIDDWKDGDYLGVYNPDKDEWRFINFQLASLMISLLEKYLVELEETT